MTQTPPSSYRLTPAVTVRLMGSLLLLVGVGVFVTALVVAFLDLPMDVLSVVVILALVAVLASGFGLSRLAVVVRLDDDGYQVRLVRGAGVKAARWSEVSEVAAAFSADHPVLVIQLDDGRSTTIPVEVLAVDPDELVRDLQERAQRGHGYTPRR